MPYDPLRADLPSQPQGYPNTYWFSTAGRPPSDDGELGMSIETDVAIIGGGYTGLSCAYHLASRFGVKAVVLEAHQPGWGCSGRNGSFARPAIGRLSYQQWIDRWGIDVATKLFRETHAALGCLRDLIVIGNIECDKQPDGWLKVAHRPEKEALLANECRLLEKTFNYKVDFLDSRTLEEKFFRGGEAYAALRFPDAFGFHPLKVAFGLVDMARKHGATVFSSTPVVGWRQAGGTHLLKTPKGLVRAKTVVIATNGYSTEKLHASLKNRLLPVLSNIVVTRSLTNSEREACNLRTTELISDTRKILNFYRLLPDNRMLFGSRGPLLEDSESAKTESTQLVKMLCRKFPSLRGVPVDFSWGGWVAITFDMMPHIHHAEDDTSVWYAIGYNGSGVTATVHAGRQLAIALGTGRPVDSIMANPIPRLPLARLRRIGQRAAFALYGWQDEH